MTAVELSAFVVGFLIVFGGLRHALRNWLKPSRSDVATVKLGSLVVGADWRIES